jgi:nucleoside-diphosphate-sugar epimerase
MRRLATQPRRLGVVGYSGFIGSHVLTCGNALGLTIAALNSPRVYVGAYMHPLASAEAWRRNHRQEFEQFARSIAGLDVVINAAGMARPGSGDERSLYSANAVQPLIIALACHRADVGRLVHVSTAAVQGRLDPLDETARYLPFSPYSRSKVAGERALLDMRDYISTEVVIYRPTSVQGIGRAVTLRLGRLAQSPVVPIVDEGDQPLPLSLIQNVAFGITFVATSGSDVPIVLQPWEAITTRRLLDLLHCRRLVRVPTRPVQLALSVAKLASTRLPSFNTSIRGLELLYRGQRISSRALADRGFTTPVGLEGWQELSAAMRLSARRKQPFQASEDDSVVKS